MISADVSGDKELIQALGKLDKRGKKIARQAARAVAKVVADDIGSTAPARTGLLRSKIKVRSGSRRRGQVSMIVRTGTRPEMGIDPSSRWYYPAIVEYGNAKRGLAPNPFMARGLERNRARATAALRRHIWRGIAAATTGAPVA